MNRRERMDLAEKMLREGTHSYKAISEKCIITIDKARMMAIALRTTSPQAHLTSADHDTINIMVRNGKTDQEIADTIGCYVSSVYRYRKSAGIKPGAVYLRQLVRDYKRANPKQSVSSIARLLELNRGTVTKALKEADINE